MSLKPFVYWAQTENDIFLKVDVKKSRVNQMLLLKRKRLNLQPEVLDHKGMVFFKDIIFWLNFFYPLILAEVLLMWLKTRKFVSALKRRTQTGGLDFSMNRKSSLG